MSDSHINKGFLIEGGMDGTNIDIRKNFTRDVVLKGLK